MVGSGGVPLTRAGRAFLTLSPSAQRVSLATSMGSVGVALCARAATSTAEMGGSVGADARPVVCAPAAGSGVHMASPSSTTPDVASRTLPTTAEVAFDFA